MKKYNHLFKIPNDSEGKAFVSNLKKYMKDSESIHLLRIKGRNPYVGYKAYNGGADGYVRLNEAENIAVYLKEDTNSYHKGFQAGQRASEWHRIQAVDQGYERGYNEAFNDAKEQYEAKVKTDSYVAGYAQALDDFKTVLRDEYDYLGRFSEVGGQHFPISDFDPSQVLEKIDNMDEAKKALLRYKKPCEVSSEDAFKRGIQVGKNIAYKRSVEAIQDHQEAVEGWEVKDA